MSTDTSSMLPAQYASGGLSPRQLLVMLWAQRKHILIAALSLAVLAGILSKLVLPKSYYSEAALLIDFDVNDPVSGRDFPAQLAASYMSTQQAIIESPRVIGPVVDKLGWMNDPEYAKGASGGREALRDWIMQKVIAKNITIKTFKDTRLIYIGYEHKNAAEAARVVNTVAEVYMETQKASAGGNAKGRAQQYFGQLEELRTKVVAAQAKLAAFRSETGLLEFDSSGGIEAERLAALNNRLSDLEVIRRTAEARAAAGGLSQDAAVLGSGLIQGLKSQVLQLQNNFTLVARELGPRHPDYIAAQKQLDAARQSLALEESRYAASIRTEARSSGSTESAIEKAVAQQRQRVLDVRQQQDQGATLVRDVDAAKKVYERALDLYDKVVTPSETSFTNITLIAPGTPAIKPSKPITRVNVLLGLIGGGLLAAFMALLWELSHRRIRCDEDLEAELGLPILATVGSLT